MCERELWGAVAHHAMLDHARLIRAARRQRRRCRETAANADTAVLSEQDEIETARRYFESHDWRIVAALAGIDADPEQLVRITASEVLLAHVARRERNRETRA